MTGLRQRLDELDALLVPSLPIPPAHTVGPALDHERTSLVIDGLWSTDDYPEYSQTDVLHAYRLGAEDQRALHYARLSALPALTSALRAVANLADELEESARRYDAPDRLAAATRIRAALAPLAAPGTGDETTPSPTNEKASTPR